MLLCYKNLHYSAISLLCSLIIGCAATDTANNNGGSSDGVSSNGTSSNNSSSESTEPPFVDITHTPNEGKIDIYMGGQYFSSYLYDHPLLNKAVLFPVISASGITVTRGYPLDTREGESTDHTHQHGVWFNHGDVNGIDFWNAGRTPPKSGVRYGRIEHDAILELYSGDTGQIHVAKNWLDDNGKILLREQTLYHFSGNTDARIITHTTTLTALDEDIHFNDSKEALFAIRVAAELEIRDNQATYRNSEGIEGYPEVWGKRASWMQLKGNIQNTPVSLLMFDSPSNVNYPAHWMARDYGLFAVDNLGNAAFGDKALNYVLSKNTSQTFKHQLIISDGNEISTAQINAMYEDFINSSH